MATSLLVCDSDSQHLSEHIASVAREADLPDLGRRVPWIIRRHPSDIGSSAESRRCGVTQGPILAGGHFPGRAFPRRNVVHHVSQEWFKQSERKISSRINLASRALRHCCSQERLGKHLKSHKSKFSDRPIFQCHSIFGRSGVRGKFVPPVLNSSHPRKSDAV
jgi:hypothetical protein